MGIGLILFSIFLSAALLWILLRLLAKDEADLSLPRYSVFGALYWFLGWMATAGMNFGPWMLIPLWAFTVLAVCQFFYVTMGKSLWLAALFVVVRSLVDFGIVAGFDRLMG